MGKDDKIFMINLPVFSFEIGSLDNIDSIILILGRGCNMNCPHCNQNHPDMYASSCEVSNKFIDWLKNWASSSNKKSKKICFWGGEPLIYWDKIVLIVEALKNIKGIVFCIVTNGLLLDDEKIRYMEDNYFSISLSYDAPEPLLLRSDVPGDDVITRFNSYSRNKVVIAVYTSKYSLVDIYKGIAEIFPGADRTWGFIRAGEGVPPELSAFPVGKVKKDIIDLYDYYLKDDKKSDLSKFFKDWYVVINTLKNAPTSSFELLKKYPVHYCRHNVNKLSLDLSGNVYLCQNGHKIIGNVFVSSLADIQEENFKLLRKNIPVRCLDCKWLGTCSSGCSLYEKDSTNRIKQCNCFMELNRALWDLFFS